MCECVGYKYVGGMYECVQACMWCLCVCCMMCVYGMTVCGICVRERQRHRGIFSRKGTGTEDRMSIQSNPEA